MIPAARAVWFRRLFVGALVELLQARGIRGVYAEVQFGPESRFRYPHLDNHLRFVGEARLEIPADATFPADFSQDLRAAWAELVDQIDILPVGDALSVGEASVAVRGAGSSFVVVFDLRAD